MHYLKEDTVPILTYHNIVDKIEDNPATTVNISTKKFESQIKWLSKHGYKSLTMDELYNWKTKNKKIPRKSVLITFDDGGWTKHAVDLLGEYKMYATFFLVTSWFNPKDYYKNEYIEFHSHSHDLHNGGKCPGGQGGAIKCLDKEKILDDLKKTREVLNGSTAFCYPFYEYNSYSENLLKEAGFTMAFIGEVRASYGPYKLAEVGGDKMKIPRFVVVNYTTIAELNRCFNEIR
jgi:peptidoglycan/xylan/chitin deacetylase (PgdA/CDA1 family)